MRWRKRTKAMQSDARRTTPTEYLDYLDVPLEYPWSTPGVPARLRPTALGPTRPTSALKVESRFLDRRLMGVVKVSSSSFACAQPAPK